MPSAIYRRPVLLVFVLSLLAAGCIPIQSTQRDDRYPRRPPARIDNVVVDRAFRGRIAHDAPRYGRRLDRVLRLNRRQEQRIHRILSERAYDRVRHARARDWERVYPFPRSERRATRDWWIRTDRRIARELNRRQRARYADLFYDRYDRRRDRPRGHHRGDWDDDDDWVDDDWDDDDG
jgi:hypothetical protein